MSPDAGVARKASSLVSLLSELGDALHRPDGVASLHLYTHTQTEGDRVLCGFRRSESRGKPSSL